MPKYELSKDNNNIYAKGDRAKITKTQPYTKNYRQLRNASSGRKSLPQILF